MEGKEEERIKEERIVRMGRGMERRKDERKKAELE